MTIATTPTTLINLYDATPSPLRTQVGLFLLIARRVMGCRLPSQRVCVRILCPRLRFPVGEQLGFHILVQRSGAQPDAKIGGGEIRPLDFGDYPAIE